MFYSGFRKSFFVSSKPNSSRWYKDSYMRYVILNNSPEIAGIMLYWLILFCHNNKAIPPIRATINTV